MEGANWEGKVQGMNVQMVRGLGWVLGLSLFLGQWARLDPCLPLLVAPNQPKMWSTRGQERYGPALDPLSRPMQGWEPAG